MEYSVIFGFSLILMCGAVTDWCFISDRNVAKLEIYCSNEEIFPENCSFPTEQVLVNAFDATELQFHECEFDVVTSNLNRSKSLQTLDISYSGHESLDSFPLEHKHLTKLNASYNDLSEIPNGYFNETPEISGIDLSFNSFKRIGSMYFAGAIKLTKIHLSNNQITKIDERSFVNLDRLKFVDLRNNWIQRIGFAFPKNAILKTLHLESNHIQRLDCSLISLVTNTTTVHLSWQYVTEFDTSCLKNQLQVILDDRNDTILPALDNKIEIHCEENGFENLREFKVGRHVESGLEIVHCLGPSLAKLDLSGKSIGALEPNTFRKFTNLRELLLNHAQLLHFDFRALEHLKELRHLDISHNDFQSLSNLTALESIELLIFNIAENHLENTLEIVQHLNSSIETMILSGNYLGEIQASTFEKFHNLRELQLRNMNITHFEADPFDLLKSLVALDISKNDLSHFDFAAISTSLNNLIIFHAANCQISNNLSDLVKHFGPSLYYLDLSGNPIGDIDVNLFQALDLRGLNLANSNLSNFNFDALANLRSLHSLNISHNHLNKANLTSLSNALDELNLDGNDLTEIDTVTYARFPQLSSITIGKNQFSCEYVAMVMRRFKREWTSLEVADSDAMNQKNGQECSESVLKWNN